MASRRTFLIKAFATAGGLGIAALRSGFSAVADTKRAGRRSAGIELTPWLTIAPDDTVVIRSANADIGNGTLTQAAMTVAEELQCDWRYVRAEFAPIHRVYTEGAYQINGKAASFFGGSSTIPELVQALLQVGASARERLKVAAARRWNVPVGEIEARSSLLTHRPSLRVLRYGEVAADAGKVRLIEEPTLKPRSAWTLLGKATPSNLNAPSIAVGKAIYGMDVRPPGLVYAALMQSPVHGGRAVYVDSTAALKMAGVRAVLKIDPSDTPGSPVKRPPFGMGLVQKAGAGHGWMITPADIEATAAQSAVAVIADHYWQARLALDAVRVTWDSGPGGAWKTSQQMYDAALAALNEPGEKVITERGDIRELEGDGNMVEGTYMTPFCEQSPIEPLNGTALVNADGVELWHPTQEMDGALWVAADETGLPPEKVICHQTLVGGAFGRRFFANDVRMVVAIARRYPGVPVQVIWSREEMMRQGRYRPLVATRLRARLDAEGLPHAMLARIAGHGISNNGIADTGYANGIVPNVRVESRRVPFHLMTGPFRGPGYNSFAFIVESFIDECAAAAKIDPLEYRLRLFRRWPDEGWIKCLSVAADKAGWGSPLPRGRGRGIAISAFSMAGKPKSATIVCVVATVEVSRAGVLRVEALDIAFDSGGLLNRDSVASQIEGAAIFGLNLTLNEELTVKDGRIVEGNFDQYPMLRIGDIVTKINIHSEGLTGHERFSKVGESPVGPIGPAIGNAIFAAIGKRVRTTPLRKQDLSWS